MNCGEALRYLAHAGRLGSRLGLERMEKLCGLLGNPQDRLATVHVAGTNGKGSTASMIARSLSLAGHKTGLYTSPYIGDARESMTIDGAAITDEAFGRAASAVCEMAGRLERAGDAPTAFELETAMAFWWFWNHGCRAAVIETGLGGRLDATNVIKRPDVTVLTAISHDHVELLGGTLAEIAREKCGIIKPGGVTICYPLQEPEAMAVIAAKAAQTGSRLIVPRAEAVRIGRAGLSGVAFAYDGLPLSVPMAGRHQAYNASVAVEALRALGKCGIDVGDGHIAGGVASAALPMRQELIRRCPDVLLDGAHNLDKLAALAKTMGECLSGRPVAVVMGMLRDKEYKPAVALIAGLAGRFIACAPQSPRALPSAETARVAACHCKDVRIIDDCGTALSSALAFAGPCGAVVVCGSFYLAGPVRKVLKESGVRSQKSGVRRRGMGTGEREREGELT